LVGNTTVAENEKPSATTIPTIYESSFHRLSIIAILQLLRVMNTLSTVHVCTAMSGMNR
jgi:hypothetical protein